MPWIVWVTLIVFIPLILVYFFVGRKLVSALVYAGRWKRKSVVRWVASYAVVINSFPILFLLTLFVGGQSRVPAFTGESRLIDLIFVYPFWFGLVVAVQGLVVALAAEFIRVVMLPIFRRDKERWRRVEGQAFLAILCLLAIYSAVVIVRDTWTVQITKTSITVPERARGLTGKRMVFVSDVQGDGRTDKEELTEYVAQINRLHPDLFLFGGDLVSSGEKYIASTAEIMGTIAAPLGKIAAVGDHDMFSNRDKVVTALGQAGFIIADDSTFILPIDSANLSVSLVTDTYLRRPKTGQLDRVARVAASGDYRIMLVHQPAENVVQFASQHGYDLFLAGHTHGGGIAFGIPGVFLLAPARMESKYMSGRYDVGSMAVIVTNGLGLTLAPIRFHAPAEITVLDFE